jgi:hypothetical protein
VRRLPPGALLAATVAGGALTLPPAVVAKVAAGLGTGRRRL